MLPNALVNGLFNVVQLARKRGRDGGDFATTLVPRIRTASETSPMPMPSMSREVTATRGVAIARICHEARVVEHSVTSRGPWN